MIGAASAVTGGRPTNAGNHEANCRCSGEIAFLVVVGFCGFGFLATFEPTDNVSQFFAFRIGYAVIALGCMVRVGLLIAIAVCK